MPALTPAHSNRASGSGFPDKPFVFSDCVTVGHSGHVVGDNSGATYLILAPGPVRELRWHLEKIARVKLKQLANDCLCFMCHLEFLLVRIQMLDVMRKEIPEWGPRPFWISEPPTDTDGNVTGIGFRNMDTGVHHSS